MKDAFPAGIRIITAVLEPFPDKEEELAQALAALLPGIQIQPGCLECLGGRSLDRELRFFIYLLWADAAAMERSLATEAFSVLLGALATLAATPMALRLTVSAAPTPRQAAS